MLSKTEVEPHPMFTLQTLRNVTGIALIVIGVLAYSCCQSWGQSGKEAVTLEGKISNVERKGKVTKVTLKAGQDEHTFELTAKVDLKITYQGDDEFLASGVFVKADCTKANEKYYTSDKTEVYALNPSANPRDLGVSVLEIPKPQDRLGEQRYLVSGRINKNFVPPKNTGGASRSVDAGGFGRNVGHVELTPSLFLEMRTSDSITVVFSDPTKLENDQHATATGRWSGKKFVPQSLTVKTGQKLKAAESLDELTGTKNKK